MSLDKISIFCFGASYAVALACELLLLARPGRAPRALRTGFAAAGLLAHTLFLIVQQPPLSSRFGSLMFLSWILAVFYVYGILHYRKLAWGVFVAPLVLGLVVLAALLAPASQADLPAAETGMEQWDRYWGIAHGVLLLLAAVGICVGFVASVMYLVQARRLKAKRLPTKGPRLLSLERLEEMNRRAINWAFPLLTAGVLVGAALLAHAGAWKQGWLDPRVLGAIGMWLVFALVLYLRYAVHVQGRRLAFLTIVVFALMLLTLASPVHQFGREP